MVYSRAKAKKVHRGSICDVDQTSFSHYCDIVFILKKECRVLINIRKLNLTVLEAKEKRYSISVRHGPSDQC